MHFTVANHGVRHNPNGYINYPDVSFDDIPDMVTNDTNYCACRLKDNYRLDDNFDGCVDVLVIDVDEACSIEQAKQIFKKYEFYLITTRSHQKDKGGIKCDRFRLFIPLDKTVHIREQMEEIYSRFIDTYFFVDTKCRNVSRFFYSSPRDAYVYHNKGKKYPTKLTELGIESKEEVSPIPNHTLTHKDAVFRFCEIREEWVNEYGEVLESDNQTDEEAKLKGVEAFLESDYYQGNKSNCLFRASAMMKRDGFDEDFIADYLIDYWQKHASRTDKMRDALQNIKGGFKT